MLAKLDWQVGPFQSSSQSIHISDLNPDPGEPASDLTLAVSSHASALSDNRPRFSQPAFADNLPMSCQIDLPCVTAPSNYTLYLPRDGAPCHLDTESYFTFTVAVVSGPLPSPTHEPSVEHASCLHTKQKNTGTLVCVICFQFHG